LVMFDQFNCEEEDCLERHPTEPLNSSVFQNAGHLCEGIAGFK
jgi:hypothetical protein